MMLPHQSPENSHSLSRDVNNAKKADRYVTQKPQLPCPFCFFSRDHSKVLTLRRADDAMERVH